MDIVNFVVSLASGAVGGNAGGAALSEKNLGPVVNTILGLIGGGGADFIMKALGFLHTAGASTGTAATGFDLTALLMTIGAGAVGGGALTVIVTLIKDFFHKKY